MRYRAVAGWVGAAMVLAAAPAWAAAWQTLTDPAEKFSIELPGAAQRKAVQTPLNGGGGVPTVEHTLTADGASFSISASNLGVTPAADKIPLALSNSADAMIAKDGGTVSWKRTVQVSGRPAVDAEYAITRNGRPWRGRLLVTFANQRLYNLVLRQPGGAPAATQERVVRSLRLLD